MVNGMDKRHRWMLAAALGILMVVTRYHHFGSILHLPDASWAIFFAGGFYLRRPGWLAGFLLLAGGIDYFAITQGGSSGYCISPAYPFLLPAYGALWLGGRVFAHHYHGVARDLVRLLVTALVATTVCFFISNGAFYWLSGRVDAPNLSEYASRFLRYYPMFLRGTLGYLAVFAAIQSIFSILRDIYRAPGQAPR